MAGIRRYARRTWKTVRYRYHSQLCTTGRSMTVVAMAKKRSNTFDFFFTNAFQLLAPAIRKQISIRKRIVKPISARSIRRSSSGVLSYLRKHMTTRFRNTKRAPTYGNAGSFTSRMMYCRADDWTCLIWSSNCHPSAVSNSVLVLRGLLENAECRFSALTAPNEYVIPAI